MSLLGHWHRLASGTLRILTLPVKEKSLEELIISRLFSRGIGIDALALAHCQWGSGIGIGIGIRIGTGFGFGTTRVSLGRSNRVCMVPLLSSCLETTRNVFATRGRLCIMPLYDSYLESRQDLPGSSRQILYYFLF